MKIYEWLKIASKDEIQEFLWNVYHCGNVDGRSYGEDSPPHSLPSYFGTHIVDDTIENFNDEVMEVYGE